MSDYELLEKTGALMIIYVLNLHGKLARGKLKQKCKISGNTVDKRILELKTVGIINESPKQDYQGPRNIWLTKKGENIAKNINFNSIKKSLI